MQEKYEFDEKWTQSRKEFDEILEKERAETSQEVSNQKR